MHLGGTNSYESKEAVWVYRNEIRRGNSKREAEPQACKAGGSSYTWTVVEKENSGYTVQVERDGITFVITNTYVPEEPEPTEPTEPTPTKPTNPTKPNLPQTGQLWWPVPVLLIAGLLFVILGLIRRRRFDDEP